MGNVREMIQTMFTFCTDLCICQIRKQLSEPLSKEMNNWNMNNCPSGHPGFPTKQTFIGYLASVGVPLGIRFSIFSVQRKYL